MSDLPKSPASEPGLLTIVLASSAGTAFEWYDFFIFSSMTPIIAKTFLSNLSDTAGFAFALAIFAVGFLFRPLGALVFGHFGDRNGRKGAFLVTVSLMGAATIGIGLLPTYGQAGLIAPALLVLLRSLQGFALGGEYGGAAIFVTEHAPDHQRGKMTALLQSAAGFGLITALVVILITRNLLGEKVFGDWGWRIPFIVSLALLILSLWIRVQLSESPAFKQMQAEGAGARAPLSESLQVWANLKRMLIALFAIMIAQGTVWFTGSLYAQTFMEKLLHVDPVLVNQLLIVSTVISLPLYMFFAVISDKLGRKPVMIFGMILSILAFFPGYKLLTQAANPELFDAARAAPVVVRADPADCSLQFDPIGKARFASSCDIAKSVLASAGIPYDNQPQPAGAPALVEIGGQQIASADGRKLAPPAFKALKTRVDGEIKAALSKAGYPAKANPKKVNGLGILGVLVVFLVGATALFGPQAAALVEMFPTRIRYTALSLPYNIGAGWFGGFLPMINYAIVVATGDIYAGLLYPVITTGFAVVFGLLFWKDQTGLHLARVGEAD